MTTLETFILLAAAAIIQASFQLSVSMVTVMSGHALGKKTALARVSQLTSSFSLGVITMTALSLAFLSFVLASLFAEIPTILWSASSGLMVGVGLAVWLFYYRRGSAGTILWIPRPMADYLTKRARATTITPEAFGLGLTSVIGEVIFTIALTFVAALLLVDLPLSLQLAGLLMYVVVATLPLTIIATQVSAGESIARIQRWREQNKHFLQFAGGGALIVLGVYIYVERIIVHFMIGGGA